MIAASGETDRLTQLAAALQQVLQGDLPGQEAQKQMMPYTGDMRRFSLEVKKGAHEGGVLIWFYEKAGELYFPLIQRPDYDGVHARQMSFPGGRRDPQDRDIIDTALRENEEETGIAARDIEVLGTLTDLYIIASHFNVTPVVGVYRHEPAFTAHPFEVEEIIEVPLRQLCDPANRHEKPMTILQGVTIMAPYYLLAGKVVWGATAMILAELKEILQGLPAGLL